MELAKPGAGVAVHAIFLEPSARHALIVLRDAASGRPGDTLYAHATWRKARPVPKLRGCAPVAVAWHTGPGGATDASTREVLLGSAVGALYELAIDAADKKEKAFRPLLELREREPVCGLHMEARARRHATLPARACCVAESAATLTARARRTRLHRSRPAPAAARRASRCWPSRHRASISSREGPA